LEQENVQTTEVVTQPVEPVESDIAQMAQDTAEMSQIVQDVEEGRAIQDTLEKMEVEPENAAQIAKEHLLTRISCKGNSSLESVGNRVETVAGIAQEGIGKRFVETVKRVMTSEEKLEAELKAGLDKIAANGTKEEDIKEPGWGRVFSEGVTGTASASDVEKKIDQISKIIHSPSTIKILKNYSRLCEIVAIKLDKSTFVADDAVVKELEALHEDASKIAESVKIDYAVGDRSDINFKPVNQKEADKIGSKITKLLSDKTFNDAISEASKSFDKYWSSDIRASSTRLKSILIKHMEAADVKVARDVISKMENLAVVINTVITDKSKLIYGAVKYISASAK